MAALVLPLSVQTASIGIPDTLFLMLLALVVFGPRRLPEIGRQIGKLMYEFRKVSNDFKYQMEEELRASEEADRQKKLKAEAASQVTLAVPPQPVAAIAAEAMATEQASAADTASATATAAPEPEVAPAVAGEVRGEPRRFPPDQVRIQPPSTGETVAANRPFRAASSEVATESGDQPERTAETPVVVADEGRTGTEIQPGVEPNLGPNLEPGPEFRHEPNLKPDQSPESGAGLEQPAHHA